MKRVFTACLWAICFIGLCLTSFAQGAQDKDKDWLPAGSDHKNVTALYRVAENNTIEIKFKNSSDQGVALTFQIHCEQKEASGWKKTSSYRGADASIDAHSETTTGYSTGYPVRNVSVELITVQYGSKRN